MDNMNNPKFFFDLSCNPDYDLAGLTQAGFEAYGFGRLM
ncbi:unnamed protein product [Cuscuta epithymum]|uniref:Uncharacterized protein n=1 Tax=Cuscuta epithymum TaxID=186058 RepID=A0AAV0FTQ5_9ASTE|nr:unnamed protein product [Cuscuta epithymum]CAH9138994.1 unnamed protein product [Cuscuta epithymum]